VVILETPVRRTPAATPGRQTAPAGKRSRAKTAATAGLQKVEARHRALTDLVEGKKDVPIGQSPGLVSLPGSALDTPSDAPQVVSYSTSDQRLLHAARARQLLQSPSRLRESIILSEILQPPLAVRRRRSSRG
jgi:hypothetical protein